MPATNKKYSINLFNTVSPKERAFIARQLAVMLNAGLPLVQAVSSLSEQTQNQLVNKALTVLQHDLENGYRFSDAAKKHPKIFNNIFISVSAAGEASGKLDVGLGLLADELERDNGFRGRIIGSMIYPAFIVGAMFIVGVIMVTRIVPALEGVFAESNVALPWTTQLVVTVTNSIISYWYLYIFILAAIAYAVARFIRTPGGQRSFNNFLFKLPVIGDLFTNLEMARMTRILGILVQAGVPIIQALDAVALVLDSTTYRDIIVTTARNVERGAPISQTLAKYPEFPTTITEMIGVGEKTGRLEEVLGKLADYYEVQTNQASKNFASLIEPVVFVIVGLGVAFLVFSIIVPIYNLSSVIQ